MTYSFAAQEELEAEFNARFDYVSEAYGATARDCNEMAESDAREELREYCAIMEPEYGPYIDRRRKSAYGFTGPTDMPMNTNEAEYGPFDNSRRNIGSDDLPW